MTRISSVFNNWAHGKTDHDLNGRFDLPLYSSSADIIKNFFTNFKGNAIYSPGFENMVKFEDCRVIEFKFNKAQSYLCLFYDLKVKFLSYDTNGNFGFVQSGGSDLEVVTPYTLAQAKQLKYDQNADVMILCHEDVQQQALTRVSATSFTVAVYALTADPFDDAAAAGTVGYPACCRFYEGRLYFAAPKLKPTTIYGSQAGDYSNMTVGTDADDGLEFQIAELSEAIEWLHDGVNSLIAGSNEGLATINGGDVNSAITPTNVTAKVSNTDGADPTQPIKKDDLIFYVRQDGRALDYFRYDILTESFKAQDVNFLSYDITIGKIEQLVYKKDRNDLIFTIRGDGALLSFNFNEREKVIAWHEHIRSCNFKQLAKITNNDGDVELFALVEKNDDYFMCRWSDVVEFPLLQTFYTGPDNETADMNAAIRYYAEKLKECNYLDISSFVKNYYTSTITYVGDTEVGSTGTITSTAADFTAADVGNRIVYKTATGLELGYFKITGFTSTTEVDVEVLYTPTALSYSSWYRTFNTITGLTDFIGDTKSVVGDGGYLDDYVVDASGEIALDREITVACVGDKYEGLLKTFVLGANIQGINLQTTLKKVYEAGVRFVASAGGEIGTSLYDMKDIQDFSPTGLYDNPPIPMDDTKYIPMNDSNEKEKVLYVRQSKPLPLNVTALMASIKFSTKI